MTQYQVTVSLECFIVPGPGAVKTADDHMSKREFILTPKSSMMPIGRASSHHSHHRGDPDVDNAFFSSPVVSREHAQIFMEQDSKHIFIKDLASMHGTTVRGTKLKPGEVVRLNNFDIVTIGSNVLHGDREFQARTFTVTYKFATYLAREPSVVEIDGPMPALQSSQATRSKPGSIVFTVPGASESEDEESDEEELHIEKVVAVIHEKPGNSPCNPLNIDDEMATRPAQPKQPDGNKVVKRTYIGLNELFNDTDDEDSDGARDTSTVPVLPPRLQTKTSVLDAMPALSELLNKETPKDAHALTSTPTNEYRHTLNEPTDSADEHDDGMVFTSDSSCQSSPATSPAPFSDKEKKDTLDVPEDVQDYECSIDSDLSSVIEDDRLSLQWSAGEDEMSVLDSDLSDDEYEPNNTKEPSATYVHKAAGESQPQAQVEIRGGMTNQDPSTTKILNDSVDHTEPLGYIASIPTSKSTVPAGNEAGEQRDAKKPEQAKPGPHVQQQFKPMVNADAWYPPRQSSLFSPSYDEFDAGYYADQYTGYRKAAHKHELTFEASMRAPRNEYHSMYPVNGLNSTSYSLGPYHSASSYVDDLFLPKQQQGQHPDDVLDSRGRRYEYADPWHKSPWEQYSLNPPQLPRQSEVPNPLGSHPVQAPAPWAPTSRSKVSISNIVDPAPLSETSPTTTSTLKRKADFISSSDEPLANATTSTTTEESSVKLAAVDVQELGSAPERITAKVTPLTEPASTVHEIAAEEPPRKKARTYAASARPFLLGALFGGVAVIGALITLPESFF